MFMHQDPPDPSDAPRPMSELILIGDTPPGIT
jgi:hypothetical protein